MRRPSMWHLTDDNDHMHMVRHHYKHINIDTKEMARNLLPALPHNASKYGQLHRSIHDFSKDACSLPGDNGNMVIMKYAPRRV
jgi:hypothetical protein